MRVLTISFAIAALVACTTESDAEYATDVATEMHQALAFDIHDLVEAAETLQEVAPVTTARGWDPQADAVSIQAMKNAWAKARDSYEHVEGAVAPTFPDLDFAIDARYEQYLAKSGADAYAFDGQGVVGLDAIERIVWSDVTPQPAIDFEKTLSGYAPSAFPATEQEAADFKNVLCAKLLADARALEIEWAAQPLDVGAAYAGLISLMTEQEREITLGQSSAEESRYSQRTMDDLRANVDGTEAIYGLFRPWITSKGGGSDADAKIEAGFVALENLYAQVQGDALPDATSADYAALLGTVTTNVDPQQNGSIAFEMTFVKGLLAF